MPELVDLSQPWGPKLSPWPGGDAPRVWRKSTLNTDGVNEQEIRTDTHTGTHIDAPRHFVSGGGDVAGLSLDGKLFGEGVVADISDDVGEYDIYEPEHVTDKVDVREGDILVINTGFHERYPGYGAQPDELGYFCKHPGPSEQFHDWALEMELNWIGVDVSSADHPMNTPIAGMHPRLREEFERKHGAELAEIFPPEGEHMMHKEPFRRGLIHAENLGGDIDDVSNERVKIGAFPWKFVGGDACICRIVAFRGW